MSNAHTPGPWRVGRHFTDDEGYREIAIEATVRGVDVVPASVVLPFPNLGGMQEANARLIAAAPDLLVALQKRVDSAEQRAFEAWLVHSAPSGDVDQVQAQWEDSTDLSEFCGEWDVERAAIAKATGGTTC